MRITHVTAPAVSALALWLLVAPARAGIVSTGTDVTVISAPSAAANTGGDGILHNDDLESDTAVFVWAESSGVLAADTAVQIDGTETAGLPAGGTPGVVSAGTAYVSYFFHWDHVAPGVFTQNNPPLDWSVTFTHPILGVFTTAGNLNATDGPFGPAGLTYANTSRGFENDGLFTISNGGHTLTIDRVRIAGGAGAGADQFRVLVNPEPGTWALFGLGALGLGAAVRRRKRRRSPVVRTPHCDS